MAEQQDNQGVADQPSPQPEPDKPTGKSEPAPKAAPRQPRSTLTREQRAALADRVIGKDAPDPKASKKPVSVKADTPASSPKTSPNSDSAPEVSTGENEKDSPSSSDKSDAEPSSDTKQSDASKSELADLLKAGQLEELAEKLGVDKKTVDVSNAKLRLARSRTQEADAKLRKAEEATAQAAALKAEAKKEYGAPHKAREAYDKGDFAEFAQWIAQVADDDFASVTRNVANATKGMDEKTLKTFQKERELRLREQALKDRETSHERKATDEQRTAKAVKTIEAKCTGHEALKLRGGSKLILRRLEEAFDPKTGELKMGYKQAADAVLAEFLEDAKALGLTKAAAATKAEPEPEKEPPRARKEFPAPKGKTDDGEPKLRGLTFEERAARAARQFERSRP